MSLNNIVNIRLHACVVVNEAFNRSDGTFLYFVRAVSAVVSTFQNLAGNISVQLTRSLFVLSFYFLSAFLCWF